MCVPCVTRVRATCQSFRQDVEGGITAFTATIFGFMLLALGMGIDFIRHEAFRAELQNAVDRGVLAAAAADQVIDAETTVRAYMKSTNYIGGKDYNLVVDPVIGADGMTVVTATADYDMPTFFLKLAGIDTLKVAARGAAVEGIRSIELALVLDVSTSMAYETTGGTTQSRLSLMKSSASSFVNTLLAPANAGADVTVSLVPFAGQVNPGPTVSSMLRSSTVHNYSHCVEFGSTDYATTALPALNSLSQSQYFNFSKPWNEKDGVTYTDIAWGWCPAAGREEIVYFSQDATELTTAIDGLMAHEATGTQNGMKWGVSLLDPTSDVIYTGLTGNTGRPYSYAETTNKKFLVIMTDGNTTQQLKLKSSKYDTATEREYYASNLSADQGEDFDYETTTTANARAQFLASCQAAKDAGIIVFTIGFDIADGSDAQTDMAACATSSAHFHDVDGTALTDAFSSIASTIQKLKLTS